MSQDKSSMFSDAVYLVATTFYSALSWGDYQEKLPDGTRVSQRKLAELVVLAAFAYLYHKKLVDFELGERKSWFRKKKSAKVKSLQSSVPDLSGLELVIFSRLRFNENCGNGFTHVYDLTQLLIDRITNVANPWREVLKIVNKNLLQRGILNQVVKEKEKQVTELQKTLEQLQSKGELYQQILSDIEKGIASREYQGD